MTEINRAYVLRLYALHDRIATEIAGLGYDLRGDDGLMAPLTRIDQLIGELETAFSEVLTDEERNIPTDEEFAKMVDELTGKENDR